MEISMARKKLTKKQIAERTAKAKATRERKKREAMQQLGLDKRPKVTKPRKKRKMTEEQKKAAAERLRKAREAKGQPKYTQYAENIRDIAPEHPFSIAKTRAAINNQKDLLKSIRSYKDSKVAKERELYNVTKAYIENLEAYLRTGVYTDSRYGEERQSKVKVVCRTMAYNKDGTPKRTQGVYYADIDAVWTAEMEAAWATNQIQR